jgi:hypothetical protein
MASKFRLRWGEEFSGEKLGEDFVEFLGGIDWL